MQRDEHGGTTLQRLVQTVVEELAEEREQAVVRRRQPDVGGHVGDEQRLVSRNTSGRLQRRHIDRRIGSWNGVARDDASVPLGTHREAGGRNGGRVRRCLIDDQVADNARLRIDDRSGLLLVAGGPWWTNGERGGDRLGIIERWSRQTWERLVGLREVLAPGHQVVARPVDGPQTVRRQIVGHLIGSRAHQLTAVLRVAYRIRIRRVVHLARLLKDRSRMSFGDLDLLENEREIRWRDGETLADRRG